MQKRTIEPHKSSCYFALSIAIPLNYGRRQLDVSRKVVYCVAITLFYAVTFFQIQETLVGSSYEV